MRAQWTPEELDGHVLVWLVEVHFPTGIVRFATHTIDVEDGSESYHYPGTSDPMMYAEKADLFDGIPSPAEMGISGVVDLDLPALYMAGHRYSYLVAEVSQVRAIERPEGLEVIDAYNDRCRLLTGRTRAPQWGRATSEGHTWFAADVVNEWFASSAVIPAFGLAVSDVTWPGMTRAAEDEGVTYPVVIGYPGYDSASDFPVGAAPVCWINRRANPVALVGTSIAATTMRMVHSTNPYGITVNHGQEYTPWGEPIEAAVPSNGGAVLTVVDYESEGYDLGGANPVADVYRPNEETESRAFVAFNPTTGGGILWRGELLRGAGDVLGWAMEQSGYRVDWGMFAVAQPWLNQYKIDTIISARVKASAWLQEQLIPLLPVSMMTGPDGIYPLVWRGNDVGPEDCIVIDADNDPRIEVSDTAFDDDSETANRFTVEYGWDASVRATRYTVRVGPGAGVVPESDDYAHTIFDNAGYGAGILTAPTSRVRVFALAKGFAGIGIQINASYQAGAGTVVTDGTNSVDVDINDGGTQSAEAIATAINAGSALVRAVPEGDTTTATIWSNATAVTPATSRTFLTDYGTYPDPRCEASRLRRRRESADGTVDAATVKASIVMDHTTARGIATWMAAAKADERTTVSVEAPDEVLAGLRPLSPVLLTYTPAGLVSRIGWAEEVERHSDGRTAARLVFLG